VGFGHFSIVRIVDKLTISWSDDPNSVKPVRRIAIVKSSSVIVGCVVVALLGLPRLCAAQSADYPSQRITLVVAFAPGGAADAIARLVGPSLSKRLGQPVVVENRGGASGSLAARQVTGAAADGHTVLVTTTSLLIAEILSKKAGYTTDQLAAVAIPASTPEMFATSVANPAKDLADFLRGARGKPITYATSGPGSGSHLGAAYFFKTLAKVEAVHVPYQGGGPAVAAAIGGHVDLVSNSLPAMIGPVQQGSLKALAIAGRERGAALGDVPTLTELGYEYDEGTWVGFFLPARNDPAIVARLNRAINDSVRKPEVRERIAAVGFFAEIRSPAETARHLAEESKKFRRIVAATGITAD
jgi:tripartite-type tricarboxylate transporter receptor subunit TctC